MERILIYRFGQLGDTIVALPAFWEIRNLHPDAKISLLSEVPALGHISPASILPLKGLIDEYLLFPIGKSYKRAFEFISLALKIRKYEFQRLYYLSPRLRKGGWSNTRDIIFFRIFCGLSAIYGHKGIPQLTMSRKRPLPLVPSETQSLMSRLFFSGVQIPSQEQWRYDVSLTEAERTFAKSWFNENLKNTSHAKTGVALGVGSKWPSKQWPVARFEALGLKLIRELGAYPIIFGGPEDAAIGNKLILSWGDGINLCGVFGIRHSIAIMEYLQFYVGNDTGTMHMASSAGLRCVCIFSSQDWPGRWNPNGIGHRIHRGSVECEGCELSECDRNLECLTQISVEEVYGSCSDLFKAE